MKDWRANETERALELMEILPRTATDEQLVEVVHRWVRLLEAQDYQQALSLVASEGGAWTPELLRQCIEEYGQAEPDQRVTLHGSPTDITQRIEVSRWPEHHGCIGEVWYDLNINGVVSDVTATFDIRVVPDGLLLSLDQVHVM